MADITQYQPRTGTLLDTSSAEKNLINHMIGTSTSAAATNSTANSVAIALLKGMLKLNRGSTAIYAGTIAMTTAVAQFTARACNEVYIQNDPDNTVDILIGSSSTRSIELEPGDSMNIPVSNLNLLWGRTVSGSGTLNWLARS